MSKPHKYTEKKLIGFEPTMMTAIDDFRRKQEDLPSRTEAIRRLIQIALDK